MPSTLLQLLSTNGRQLHSQFIGMMPAQLYRDDFLCKLHAAACRHCLAREGSPESPPALPAVTYASHLFCGDPHVLQAQLCKIEKESYTVPE
eukprot:892132-Rhodomonas_salina.1